jgi:putative ABC transport system permease protein
MLRDLWLQKARTLLVILAVAVGVFGVGSVLTGYAVLTREIDDNYLGTRPASATLWTDPLDGDFVQRVRELPEIGDAEARSTLQGRMLVGPNDWRTIHLYVIWDFDDLRLSTFEPEHGAWPPADGEILIERSSLPLFGTETPESVVVKLPDGPRHQLPIAGIVHNAGLPPGWMDATGYGYLTPPTAERIGASPVFDQLKITVATRAEDKEHIRRTVARLQEWLGQQGRRVYRVEIPTPGEHPHYAQMFTMMSLLAAFGLLALVLSGVLVANLISTLLAREIRQIGVMKAVGARTRQVAGIYFGAVTLFGLAALGVGMPPGLWAGWAFVEYATAIFNFEILGDSVPLWVFAVQAVVGLLVPLAVAAYPIWRGSRTSVREAISDYGVSESAPRTAATRTAAPHPGDVVCQRRGLHGVDERHRLMGRDSRRHLRRPALRDRRAARSSQSGRGDGTRDSPGTGRRASGELDPDARFAPQNDGRRRQCVRARRCSGGDRAD